MKIKSLKLDNFAKFTDFEIVYDGKITNLVGLNGSGKTTIGLTAIWACLKGIAENVTNGQLRGQRYRFIGDAKKTADIELILLDEQQNAEIKIKNNISKDANKITFHSPEGYKIDSDWVNNLLSVAFFSAKNFTQHSSKDQALMLGIDTSDFDKRTKELKEEYTFINRKIKAVGEIIPVARVERISVSELLEEKQKADEFNNIQTEHFNTANRLKDNLKMLEEQKKQIEEKIKENAELLNLVPESKSLINTQPIIEKINNAEQINQHAVQYDNYLAKKSEYDTAKKELESNKRNQEEIAQEKLDYIKNFDFGFKELSVNEKGELMLNDRPIKEPYFSKGELEIIVAKLHIKINPGLKVRFIDDFELLDEDNQKRIIKTLLDNDFQIITAQVGDDDKNKENTVLLRECNTVN